MEARKLLAITTAQVGVAHEAEQITNGPDGKLYYLDTGDDSIGIYNPADNSSTLVALPSGSTLITGGITTGSDGNIWFTGVNGYSVFGMLNVATNAITLVPGPPGTNNGTYLAGPITSGSDGNLWFAVATSGNPEIGSLNSKTDALSLFPVTNITDVTSPTINGITSGPDGNIWFTYSGFSAPPGIYQTYYSGGVGELNVATDAIKTVPFLVTGPIPTGITSAADGNLWVTEDYGGHIDSVNPTTDAVSQYPIPGPAESLSTETTAITEGPDGNPWFVMPRGGVGTISTTTHAVATFSLGSQEWRLTDIALGSDGNLYVTDIDAAGLHQIKVQSAETVTGTVSSQQFLTSPSTVPGAPLAGRTVFLDMNHDGTLDPGDPTAVTDANGNYTLTASSFGSFNVIVQPLPGDSVNNVGQPITLAQGQVTPFVNLTISTGSSTLPLTPVSNPFGTGNPNVQTAEVKALYQIILNRAPDPGGMAYWLAQLKAGTSLASVTTGFFNSREYETDLVLSYYKGFLGRTGSSTEVGFWVGQMQRRGLSPEQVADDFLTSTEFDQDHSAPSDFVQTLYEDTLGRQGTTAEVSGWTSSLSSGMTKSQVVGYFLDSPEADNRTVVGFYAAILQRPGDPAGITTAENALASGQFSQIQLAAAFVSSPEFVHDATTAA